MQEFQPQKSQSVEVQPPNSQFDALYNKLLNRNRDVSKIISRFRKGCLQHGPISINRSSLRLPELVSKRTKTPAPNRTPSHQLLRPTRRFERIKLTVIESVKSEGSIDITPQSQPVLKRYGNQNMNPSIVNLNIDQCSLQLVNRSENQRMLRLEKTKKSKLLISNYRARKEQLEQAANRIRQYEGQTIAVHSYGLLPKLATIS